MTIAGCLAVLANPAITVDELMDIIPAPDFPTAGIIYGLEGVREGYRTGRGRVVIRARAHIEDMEKGNRQAIIIDELPYQVNKANLLIKIGELVRDKRLEGIAEIRDESDKSGMRAVIELKRGENADPLRQHPVGVLECERNLRGGSGGGRRIGNSPVCGHRLSGPERTRFSRGVVTDGEYEIERGRAGFGELVPRLGAKAARVKPEALQQLPCFGMHLAFRLAARAEGLEFSSAGLVEDRFGQDRACRISGAEEEDIERSIGQGIPHDDARARRLALPMPGLQSSGRPSQH